MNGKKFHSELVKLSSLLKICKEVGVNNSVMNSKINNYKYTRQTKKGVVNCSYSLSESDIKKLSDGCVSLGSKLITLGNKFYESNRSK